jgi:hypothetical protein
MNIKLVKLASVREHIDAHYRGEISYQKAVDLINEDANKQLKLYIVSGSADCNHFWKQINKNYYKCSYCSEKHYH